MTVWIVLAVVVVALLAGYALWLQRKIALRDKQRAEWRREVEVLVDERGEKIRHSIDVIAGAMLEGQMPLSECCIRLSALLNQLGPSGANSQFQTVHTMAGELSHIPILDEWKKLKFKERMRLSKEMATIETKYKDFILATCRDIKGGGVAALLTELTEEGASDTAVGQYIP